jgi:prepilin-type N-terminal cleavage/methylation domain-containing protein
MKTKSFSSPKEAFTFIELLVVLAIITVLTGLIAPALGASKMRSVAAGCLNNLRQLQTGWRMYIDDNNDVMIPVGPLGVASNRTWYGGEGESWPANLGNTNVASYTSSLIAPYIRSNVLVFKCPADVVPSANGQRLRSYSMNGQMGAIYGPPENNIGWLLYTNGSDLIRPSPANAFIFLDEHPGSIDDGYFELSLGVSYFPEVPASYVEGGCGLSFADGHAVIHQWQTSTLEIPVVQEVSVHSVNALPSNPDWQWLTNHGGSQQ